MRVVVNHPDVGGMYGIKRYSYELVRALANQGVDVRGRASWAKEWQVGPLRVGGLLSRRLANFIPVMGGDLLHAASYHVNPHFPQADVVTIHDVMPFSRPELYGMSPEEFAKNDREIRRAIRHAQIVTDSDHTRKEMVRVLDANPSRITRVHLGLSHDTFYPEPFHADELGKTPLSSLTKPGKLNVLVMMNTELRKRVDLVLEAACALPFVNVIRVGSPSTTTGMRSMIDRIQPPSAALAKAGRLIHLPHAGDEALRRLYSSADVVVHPSEDEGFGLPPLEALACGARVLASDIPCHREVLGDAVRYFDLTIDDIRKHLEAVWDGDKVVDKGFPTPEARIKHARTFTWERTARETMKVYEKSHPGSMGDLLEPQELDRVAW